MGYTDPSTSNQPEEQLDAGDIAKGIVLSPFKPSTYLYPYAFNPGSWSKKGFYSPFNTDVRQWKKEFGNIMGKSTSGYNAEGAFMHFPAKRNFRRIPKALLKLGPTGKNKIRGSSLNALKRRQSILSTQIKGLDAKLNQATFNYHSTLTNPNTVIRSANPAKRAITDNPFSLTNQENKIKEMTNLKNGLVKNLKLVSGKAKWIGRIGTVGKVASVVGLGMMAWDILNFIGKPLAKAGISALGTMATDFQNRFNPDMGGHLALSYLSQGAATERQRAIQAMSKASINGRSAFGSEGAMMHQ